MAEKFIKEDIKREEYLQTAAIPLEWGQALRRHPSIYGHITTAFWKCQLAIKKSSCGQIEDKRKKEKVADSITAGIANYRYVHGFPELYDHVGAVSDSISDSGEKSSKINKCDLHKINYYLLFF